MQNETHLSIQRYLKARPISWFGAVALLLLFGLSLVPTSITHAATVTYGASTTSSFTPTWNRPDAGTPPTTLSATAPNTRFDAQAFSVSVAGTYTFGNATSLWDSYLFLYEDFFNPWDPLTNVLVGVDAGTGGADLFDYELQTGVIYYLVTTGDTDASFGFVTNSIEGPGTIDLTPTVNSTPLANPQLQSTCGGGLDVGFLFDISGSINEGSELSAMRNATTAFVDALSGTASQVGIITFNDRANIVLPLTNVDDPIVNATIDSITQTVGTTNWMEALARVRELGDVDIVVTLTDGSTNESYIEGIGTANVAILASNSLKVDGIRVLGVGIGLTSSGLDNLIAISGPVANSDYYTSATFDQLAATFAQLVQDICIGSISVTKVVDWNETTPDSNQTFNICITGPEYPDGDCQSVGYQGGTVSWDNIQTGDYLIEEVGLGEGWAVTGDDTYTVLPRETTEVTLTNRFSVVNTCPIAVDDEAFTSANDAVIIDVLANDIDPDSGQTLTVISTSPSGNGNVVINDDNTVTYTPNTNYVGSDEFTYTISDGECTDTATVTVTIGNGAPVAVDDDASTLLDTPVSITVLGNDSDPDADTLSVTNVSTPSNGSAVINVDNTVTYTPNSGFVGTDTFTYTAYDGILTSNVATVTVVISPPDTCDPADLVFSGVISDGGITGTVRNDGLITCGALVGMASYLMFDNIIDNQIIFDYVNPFVNLAPGQEATLNITVPQCAAQVDLFMGEVLLSLNGVRYGARLLDAILINQGNFCTQADIPTDTSVPDVVVSEPAGFEPLDSRINVDPAASVVAYCRGGGVSLWRVSEGVGTFAFSVSSIDIAEIGIPAENTLVATENGISLYVLTTGELQINAPGLAPDYTEYVFIWDGCS